MEGKSLSEVWVILGEMCKDYHSMKYYLVGQKNNMNEDEKKAVRGFKINKDKSGYEGNENLTYYEGNQWKRRKISSASSSYVQYQFLSTTRCSV